MAVPPAPLVYALPPTQPMRMARLPDNLVWRTR